MADQVTIPGTHAKVPKWAAIAGVAAVGVLVIVYYRNKKNQAAAAAPGTTAAGLATPATGGSDPYPWDGTYNNPADPYSMDTATGITYGDESAGIGGSGYPYTGGGGYGIGGQGGTGTGGVAGPPFSTNAQWASYVIAQLEANDPNLNPTDVQNAIGEYINGQPVTAPGKNIVFDAIAIGGDPPVAGPNGYPPKVQSAGTSTSGPPQPKPKPKPAPKPQVTVPRVIGDRVENANSALYALGLKSTFGARKPGVPYVVTAQSPEAGKKVAQGSTVHLTIAAELPARKGGTVPTPY